MKTFFHILRTFVALLIPFMFAGAIVDFPKAAILGIGSFLFLALVAVLTFLAWDITDITK